MNIWPFDAPSTAVVIFAATQAIGFMIHFLNRRSGRATLIAGLYEEIVFNLKAIDKFLEKASDPPPQMIKFVKSDVKYRPHILYAQQAKFYEANLGNLPTIDRQLNRLLVDFYSDLESLEIEIEAIQFASFATVKNRENVIRNIWTSTKNAKMSGEKAKSYVEGSYKKLVLQNKKGIP